jgi:protein TonB
MQSLIMKHAIALTSMVAGGALVFSTVLYMNQQEKPPKEEASQSTVQFEVEKKPPKKKKQKRRQRQQKQRRQAKASAPKTPNLSSAISGAAIEFEGVGGLSLGAVSNELIGEFDKSAAMTEGALDDPPSVQSRSGNLEYPKDAQKRGLEGYVLLNLFVREDGSVGGVKVLDAKPSGVFEQSAKDFVREWAFTPGTYDGAPVGAWVKQKIVFQLQKS